MIQLLNTKMAKPTIHCVQ